MKRRKKRRNKETLLLTNNNKEYKNAKIDLEGSSRCPICSPNSGCNRNRKKERNWKSFRKTQWK